MRDIFARFQENLNWIFARFAFRMVDSTLPLLEVVSLPARGIDVEAKPKQRDRNEMTQNNLLVFGRFACLAKGKRKGFIRKGKRKTFGLATPQ